jgi:hypothetical protein
VGSENSAKLSIKGLGVGKRATGNGGWHVLRIRIRIFLGILDPDLDPLVRGRSGSGFRIQILLSTRKNIQENLDSCCFVMM